MTDHPAYCALLLEELQSQIRTLPGHSRSGLRTSSGTTYADLDCPILKKAPYFIPLIGSPFGPPLRPPYLWTNLLQISGHQHKVKRIERVSEHYLWLQLLATTPFDCSVKRPSPVSPLSVRKKTLMTKM